MQEPNRAKAKHALDEQHPISKANNFLNRYAQVLQHLRKYPEQKQKQFIKQYQELNIFQKYNCCELLLSNAWNYVEEQYYNRAQKQLFLVIPLCKQSHFEFDEFEIEKLFWQAFMTPRLNEEEKSDLKKLFIDSGIKVHKEKPTYNNSNGSKRGKKSGFDSFIDKFLCRCCFSARDRQ